MKDPKDVLWGGKRVGDMTAEERLVVIGRLDDFVRYLGGSGRDATIEACAVAAEAQDREGYEWLRDSVWASILRRAGANVRALKSKQLNLVELPEGETANGS